MVTTELRHNDTINTNPKLAPATGLGMAPLAYRASQAPATGLGMAPLAYRA